MCSREQKTLCIGRQGEETPFSALPSREEKSQVRVTQGRWSSLQLSSKSNLGARCQSKKPETTENKYVPEGMQTH